MALLKCPDCGKMVSPRAKVCPECGCPSEFFVDDVLVESNTTNEVKNEETVKNQKEFIFKNTVIKYPENAELFAGLFGDFTKLAFEKSKQLVEIYKKLGSADLVAQNFAVEAQKLIDEEINVILKDLYSKGRVMTIDQFKSKYSESYKLNYKYFMKPFMEKYNSILGMKEELRQKREASYANRTRWSGGGFGMKGAIKGAVQASVLNAGSSMLSGLGNAVVASADNVTVERKKQVLYEDFDIRTEICSGMFLSMQGLFGAYTDELDSIGMLGNKIKLDYDSAETQLQAVMSYEDDKDKVFEAVINSIALYPASRKFYEIIEIELEKCPAWSDFKKYWHLEFLYKESDAAYLKTYAVMDNKAGTLKLMQDLLVFEGKNPADNKRIPIGSIKSIEKDKTFFQIGIKGKFLLILFETSVNDIWVNALNNALKGQYKKIGEEVINNTIQSNAENLKQKRIDAEKYILEHYCLEQRTEAINYYRKYVDSSLSEAKNTVDKLLGKTKEKTEVTYPGIEELSRGKFRGEDVILYSGGPQNFSDYNYLVLTKKELIEIDIKKNKENVYDIYNMSKMKTGFMQLDITFKYAGSLFEKCVSVPGAKANEFIEKIQNMKKGIFE